jgi:23S rRNA pseudouridine1911/1915/1917 synthase
MNIEILYEDKDIMVVNKPSGIVVNDAKTVHEQTVQSWFWQKQDGFKSELADKTVYSDLVPEDFDSSYGSPEAIFQLRQGIVHRLDKETSGVLLLAKNPGALVHLLAQFKKRETQKKYLCLAHGKFGVPEDIISFPVGRSTQNRLKFRVAIEGRSAITSYQVQQYFPHLNYEALQTSGVAEAQIKLLKKNKNSYQGFSLVECWPKTGRTHQIRVHMSHIKHPLVGDKMYLGKKRSKLDPIWCERHFLHASQLTFTHPATNQNVTYSAPLSADLKKTLSVLEIEQ